MHKGVKKIWKLMNFFKDQIVSTEKIKLNLYYVINLETISFLPISICSFFSM